MGFSCFAPIYQFAPNPKKAPPSGELSAQPTEGGKHTAPVGAAISRPKTAETHCTLTGDQWSPLRRTMKYAVGRHAPMPPRCTAHVGAAISRPKSAETRRTLTGDQWSPLRRTMKHAVGRHALMPPRCTKSANASRRDEGIAPYAANELCTAPPKGAPFGGAVGAAD